MEQKLRSGEVAMLVAWMPQISNRQVRRLKEAAIAGQAMVMLFRDSTSVRSIGRASSLQLVLRPGTDGLLDVEIVRDRSGSGGHATVSGTRHSPRRSTARPISWTPMLASAHY
jgi:hypothetical protein